MDAETLRDLLLRSSYGELRNAIRERRIGKCADDPAVQELVLLHGTPGVIDLFFEANGRRPFYGLPREVLMRRDKMAYLAINCMTTESPVEPWGTPFVFRNPVVTSRTQA